MQQLPSTTTNAMPTEAAGEVLSTVPPIIWFIRAQMRPHRKGLSLPQFRVLVAVNAQPQASLSFLAENLGTSLPTTSRIVAGLVKKGWLARGGCDGDRRQLALQITPRGLAMLDEAWATAGNKIADELSRLNDEQRATITEAMHLLQGIFGSIHCLNLMEDNEPKKALEIRRRRNVSSVAAAE